MVRVVVFALGFFSLATLLSGCPELIGGLNVSGLYSGAWSIPAEDESEPEACPISLELVHYPGANNLEDATLVTGYVNLDFTCFTVLDSILRFQEIEVGEIAVTGFSVVGGNFLLRSEDLIGGCNGDLCISLVLTGQAIDTNSDGMADRLTGEWNALFPFAANGLFTAVREEDTEE